MPPLPAGNETTLHLVSVHGWRLLTSTLGGAIDAAIRMFREIHPSEPVRIEIDGTTIATIEDGHHDVVLVQTFPMWLRASHAAAGNRGEYPHNGAIRVLMDRENAMKWSVEENWTVILRVATAEDLERYDYVLDLPSEG